MSVESVNVPQIYLIIVMANQWYWKVAMSVIIVVMYPKHRGVVVTKKCDGSNYLKNRFKRTGSLFYF